MNPFKEIAQSVGSLLPVGLLTKTSQIDLLLPYHHVVSDEYLPHINEIYFNKNKKEFIKDLDWILKHFNAVHPDQVADFVLYQKILPEKSFLLSFDDGYREVCDIIAPILIEKGVPAIFFINPEFVDNKNLFYRCKLSLILNKIKFDDSLANSVKKYLNHEHGSYDDLRRAILRINYRDQYKANELGKIVEVDFSEFLRKQQPFLTSAQIGKLTTQGFVFGGHSMDHPHYKFLDPDKQYRQTVESINFIDRFQRSTFHYFAFPHEDRHVSQEFFTKMKESHLKCLLFGVQNQRPEKANFILHRFNAERPGKNIAGMAKSILFYNSLLRLVNRQQPVRK